jgi:putative transposase
VIKAFKYRLDPNQAVTARLEATLSICRELFNAALEERRDAYRATGRGVGFAAQSRQLPEIKAVREDVAAVHSQILQDVLWRVDAAFQRFFDGLASGRRVGYPRFKGARRYHSFTFPQSGFSLDGDTLTLSKIGSTRLWLSRPLQGTIKTLTIKREVDQWYAVFTCEMGDARLLPATGRVVGVDVNLENFLTTSDGERVENPRFFREAEPRLRRAQRQLGRTTKGSKRRHRARERVAKLHRKVKRQRLDFAHKLSRRLVDECDVIFFECLMITNMVRNQPLAKSISDVAWGQFLSLLTAKAASAGRLAVNVDPRGTTQQCSRCGETVPKGLSVRWHSCPHCRLELDRDENSAINIRERGMERLAWAAGQAVAARGGPRGSLKREFARAATEHGALGSSSVEAGCSGSPHPTFAPELPAPSLVS